LAKGAGKEDRGPAFMRRIRHWMSKIIPSRDGAWRRRLVAIIDTEVAAEISPH